MTVFKDRLAAAIRIKRQFVPSAERIKAARNAVIALVMLLLTVILTVVIFSWLEA